MKVNLVALIAVASCLAICVAPPSVVAAPLSASAGSGPGTFGTLRGTVSANGSAVQGASVSLMKAGANPGTAQLLAIATTNPAGAFTLAVPRTVNDNDVLYITSSGGMIGARHLPPEVELATSLADIRAGRLVVNELTTVAAGYSLAQFAQAGSLGGVSPGLMNAATMPRNLVDLGTGLTARFLAQAPNGSATQTLPSFNSLASIIAGCAAGTNDCAAFLDAATDAWGVRPATTWQAMTLLPTNPAGNPPGVFAAVPEAPRFVPVLPSAPTSWILALRFYGNGRQFNGPGNVAFDDEGRVWSNNNAEWAVLPKNVCPGLEIFLLDPYAPGQPVEAFAGGGLNGAGFGIALDPRGHVWVGNFGFTGSKCDKKAPTSNSVSEFRPNGNPVSKDRGYRDGPLSWPQGVKSDVKGNIWIASCGTDSLVMYPNGDNTRSKVVSTGIKRAFDMAQNADGNIFVTANGGDGVYAFTPDGKAQLPGSPFGDSTTFEKPLGAASDSLGNVWVTNSGVVNIPCAAGETLEVPDANAKLNGSVVQVGPDGSLARFGGAGMTVPWGIAIDGDDNLWVANFSGARLSHLCGARASTCPKGAAGASLSPPDVGYAFDGLQRNTGVQVDSSGNVWLANNWIEFPVPTDPFGDGLVVYLGVAAPVRTPLIGTPQQP